MPKIQIIIIQSDNKNTAFFGLIPAIKISISIKTSIRRFYFFNLFAYPDIFCYGVKVSVAKNAKNLKEKEWHSYLVLLDFLQHKVVL